MAQVTSSVGLVSGLNYQTIIDQLMTLEKKPVDQLTTKLNTDRSIETAFAALSASMLSLSLSVNRFGQSSVLNARRASSSNSSVLQASASTSAVPGTYNFRPVKQAQAQGFTSTGFASATTAVGAGTITVKRGGFVTSDTPLAALNGGAGVTLGKLRLTDRSGQSTVVDLSGVQTVNDVLGAINENGVVNITAAVDGDVIVLADHTGSTVANLTVQEVGTGRTAADLGLLGSVAAATKTGTDLVRLGGSLKLSYLNDGLGVRRQGTLDDLRITLKNGSTIDVNLGSARTIQDVLSAINADSQNSGDLTASISGDGDKLVLTDASGGGGTLSVSALNGSQAAADLGILGNEQAGGVLTGKRVLAGLNSVLLQNLRGGLGITTPGQIQLTDRSGATATVDLTAAVGLGDVIDAINSAGLGITAAVNTQGHGLTLSDTTGATASNLIVADVGGGTTAANLNLTANTTATTVQSGDLHARYINEATTLASLNGGAGISAGSFMITDKSGSSAIITPSGNTFQTVGDVIAAVNASGVHVTASINDTGDGILLTDTSGGGGSLTVADLNGGRAAADLRLSGTGTTTIDGAFTYSVTIDADDALGDVAAKLKQSGAPLTASTFNTGGNDPLKLLVSASQSGVAGRLLIDSGATGLNLTQSQQASNAVVQLTGNGATPVLFTSSTNTFAATVQGVSLTLTGTSSSSITVTVSDDSSALVSAVNQFVAGFNSVAKSLSDQTSFDSTTTTRGLLQGDSTALQMQSMLFDIVGRRYGPSNGSIRTLAQLGITVSGGQLSFDQSKLQAAMTADPDAVRQFFSTATTGAAAFMKQAVDSFTNSGTGKLFYKIDSLDAETKRLQSRIDALNAALAKKQAKLQNQFLMLEKTLSTLQTQQSSLGALSSLLASATAYTSRSR